ncbi:hypothetical protein BX600DRAFT_436450 [Xylariales sp. PMI_506]|nr:hypothetical protein BX600DRAFT_436450 [Xylariales sp. PMI_506]
MLLTCGPQCRLDCRHGEKRGRRLDLINRLLTTYVDKMEAAAPRSYLDALIESQPIPPRMVSHSQPNGGNILGVEDIVANGTVVTWLISLTEDTAENQALILPLALEFRDTINTGAKQLGSYINWNYLNYA